MKTTEKNEKIVILDSLHSINCVCINFKLTLKKINNIYNVTKITKWSLLFIRFFIKIYSDLFMYLFLYEQNHRFNFITLITFNKNIIPHKKIFSFLFINKSVGIFSLKLYLLILENYLIANIAKSKISCYDINF